MYTVLLAKCILNVATLNVCACDLLYCSRMLDDGCEKNVGSFSCTSCQ